MVGHLITLIIDAQQVIHAIRSQFLDDGVGLLADRDVHHFGHGSVVVHVASIGPPEASGGDAVPVDPLALRGVTRPPEELQDLTTGGLVAVDLGAIGEPADKNRARDGVNLQGPNGTAVVAVDGVTHRVVVVVASIGLRGEGGNPLEVLLGVEVLQSIGDTL